MSDETTTDTPSNTKTTGPNTFAVPVIPKNNLYQDNISTLSILSISNTSITQQQPPAQQILRRTYDPPPPPSEYSTHTTPHNSPQQDSPNPTGQPILRTLP